MKLRSAIFVVVLLLLTATVCAAQSPMGFSPDEFYQTFLDFKTSVDGPDCNYVKLYEETGNLIIADDELFVILNHKNNELTEVYTVFPIDDDSDDTWEDNRAVIYSTLLTLIVESGAPLDLEVVDEVSDLVIDLVAYETSKEYCGFCFEYESKEQDDFTAGIIRVVKSGSTN